MSLPKYAQVAATVRAQIAEGVLLPGQSAPSGAALARVTGFSALTCRKALWVLVNEEVLVPGHSRNSRPRVPRPGPNSAEQTHAEAARALSASLASRRRAVGQTQTQLAAAIGVSVTTVGHAETGRLWQSRDFWERADKALEAGGELLKLHGAYRVAATPHAVSGAVAEGALAADPAPSVVTATRIIIEWSDGTTTTVDPPNHADAYQVVTSVCETS